MTTTNPPQVDYSSRDYATIRQDLIDAAPSFLPAWTSTSQNDFGIALLELFAWVGDIDNWYIDRLANEAFLPTALLRTSIFNIVSLIDYQPASAQPSQATMALTLQPGAQATTLPAGSQFSTPTTTSAPGVVFETPQPYNLPPNIGAQPMAITQVTDANGKSVPITVVQGVTTYNEVVGTSDGTPGQLFALFNPEVIDGTVSVTVDEGQGPKGWTAYDDLLDAGSTIAAFSVAMDAGNRFYVNFGDGIHGRIPAVGATIYATYRTCSGAKGNVGAATITVDMTSQFYAVANPQAAAGGADPETNDQIRYNAPQSITAADRCVSLADYASVALGCPGVAKAKATSAVSTSVVLYVHPAGGPYSTAALQALVTDPTTGLAQALTNPAGTGYLDSRKGPVTVTVLPPAYDGAVGYLPVVITANVQVLAQYSAAQVKLDVTDAITSLLDFGSMPFGALITQSSVYHAIMAVPGVDWVNVTEMRRADDPAGTVGNIQAGPFELISMSSPSVITVNPNGGL